MKSRFLWKAVLSVALLFSLGVSGAWTDSGQAARALAPDAPAADGYGYWSESITYAWEEINNPVNLVTFSNPSGGFAGPISLGYSFPFYENAYSSMYINTSGMISFGQGQYSDYNQAIPLTMQPNNFIAPLWSYQFLILGNVYVKHDSTSSPQRTIIEWDHIGSDNPAAQLTFQAVLYADGKIEYRYKDLPAGLDKYTVGIEDADGIYGLQVLRNTPGGIADASALRINRPGDGARVKLTPRLQGGFVSGGSAYYKLLVKNLGSPATDRFELEVYSSVTGWDVQLVDDASGMPLTNSNSYLSVDTGPLAPGAEKSIGLKVTTPQNEAEGVLNTLVMTATSTVSAGVWQTATLQSAVPVQFSQVYVRGQGNGVRLAQIWEVNTIDRLVDDYYSGASMSMEAININDYIVTWESGGGTINRSYTDIDYRIFNRLVGSGSQKKLTNSQAILNADPKLVSVDARSPSIAVAADGKVALAWTLSQSKTFTSGPVTPDIVDLDVEKTNRNIHVNLLDTVTKDPLLPAAVNVTGDSNWYGSTSNTTYLNPMVTVLSDGKYAVCWIRFDSSSAGTDSSTLFCSFYTYSAGSLSATAEKIGMRTVSEPDTLNNLTLTSLSDGKLLVGYTVSNRTSGASQVEYTIRSSSGTAVRPVSVIGEAEGTDLRSLAFGTLAQGHALFAWLDSLGRVGYVYLDSADGYEPLAVQYLSNPDGRAMASLSITLETEGRVVFTWLDGSDYERMYFAVLDPLGVIVTQPMIFMEGTSLITSSYGYGNASYQGVYQAMLPVIRR
ncbi:MAG: hypothetical protein ACKOC5_13890 [Chloroflexota bacterium]